MQQILKPSLVYGRMVLDLAVVGYFWKITNDADNSGVPDAGLIGLVTLPIILALLIDVAIIIWLSRRSKRQSPTRKPFFFALYYSITAMIMAYGVCRYFWVDRPIAVSWSIVLGASLLTLFYWLGMLRRKAIS